jgi:hypothetical protein
MDKRIALCLPAVTLPHYGAIFGDHGSAELLSSLGDDELANLLGAVSQEREGYLRKSLTLSNAIAAETARRVRRVA